MKAEPSKTWWSADELVEARLPDMPSTKRRINARAEDWRRVPGAVRRREGRGGGWEYHWSVLPLAAQQALLADTFEVRKAEPIDRDTAWAEFEGLTAAAKAKAAYRLALIDEVDLLNAAGLTKTNAVAQTARVHGVSTRTIFNWLTMVEGVSVEDRLAFLVPRQQLAEKPTKVLIDPDFFALVKSDFLRLEQPSFTACYERAVRVAKKEKLPVPKLHQVRRYYKKMISEPTEIYCRKGREALHRFYPHQTRDKTAMTALECVQGDFHKFDLWVQWPGEEHPVRPQAVFFSDVYSGKLLTYRLSITANSHTVQLAIGDMVDRYGIPQTALLDNGREFAAKVITGTSATRFRFKIQEDDIPGLLPLLGVKVVWATPYSGQSKPIERAFRDLCDYVSKHPAFAGAYTGNKPDAKPENYGSRAVSFEEFKEVLAQEVAEHNARPNRRSEVAFRKSFDEVFEASFKRAPIRRATEEQKRLWLLGARGISAKSGNGEISFMGNRYWSEWMYQIAGQKIVARFDPEALDAGLHVYALDGQYLGHAAELGRGEFLNVEDARELARKRAQHTRAVRDTAKAEKELDAAEIAARLKNAGRDLEPERPVAEIVQIVPAHPRAPRPAERVPTADEIDRQADHKAQITRLQDRLSSRSESGAAEPEDQFQRAMELEDILKEGRHPLTPAQADWLSEYQLSSEYRGRVRTLRALGQYKD